MFRIPGEQPPAVEPDEAPVSAGYQKQKNGPNSNAVWGGDPSQPYVPNEQRFVRPSSQPEMLRCLGVPSSKTDLAAGGLFMTPRTGFPDSSETMVAVGAVQRVLNQAGAAVRVSGRIDGPTAAALKARFGVRWADTNFGSMVRQLRNTRGSLGGYSSRGLSGVLDDIAAGISNLVSTGVGLLPKTTTSADTIALLQAELNRFSAKSGFTPLVLDGKMGPDTAATAAFIVRDQGFTGPLLSQLAPSGNPSAPPAWVAANAAGLLADFHARAEALALPAAAKIAKKAPAASAVLLQPLVATMPPPAPPAPRSATSSLLPFAAAGVAIYFLSKKKKKR